MAATARRRDLADPGILRNPAFDAVAVTPDDNNDLATAPCRGIYVGGAGDIAVIMESGNAVTFKAVPLGILSVRATRIKTTGTSASNLVALY